MIEIKKLEPLTTNPTLNWGFNGYETDKIFAVSAIEIGSSFEFSLREKNQYYKKIWETNSDDINELNEIILQGLFIENILIDEKYRGQSIGKLFIKNINRKARELQCRLVELETQNTNYPAIKFYQNAGFRFTGINTKLYKDSTETALFMSFDILT